MLVLVQVKLSSTLYCNYYSMFTSQQTQKIKLALCMPFRHMMGH